MVSIPQAVSTVATQTCCPGTSDLKVVSIPQAVSTVATESFKGFVDYHIVSIPQAVSTVATGLFQSSLQLRRRMFQYRKR